MMIFHIGLGKTASTFLQYRIFEPTFSKRFHHWKSERYIRILLKLTQEKTFSQDRRFAPLLKWLNSKHSDKPVLFTCESIASKSPGFWNGSAPSPLEVASFFREIRERLQSESNKFKIIIGVRRQDQMLASRYSQVSTRNPNFSQQGFEDNIKYILENKGKLPGHKWLYYSDVKSSFDSQLGQENIFLFSAEDLKADPESVLRSMGTFCGVDFIPALREAIVQQKLLSVNRKSIAKDVWRLGSSGAELQLSADLKQEILEHFRDDNYRFSEAMNRTPGSGTRDLWELER